MNRILALQEMETKFISDLMGDSNQSNHCSSDSNDCSSQSISCPLDPNPFAEEW